MEREHFGLRERLRVRWAETDMQGIVFNGHYLTYFDVAITEYWRAIGMPYPAAFAGTGVDLFGRVPRAGALRRLDRGGMPGRAAGPFEHRLRAVDLARR